MYCFGCNRVYLFPIYLYLCFARSNHLVTTVTYLKIRRNICNMEFKCGFCDFKDEDERIVAKHYKTCKHRIKLEQSMINDCEK